MNLESIVNSCSLFHRNMAYGIAIATSIISTMENIWGRQTTDEEKQRIVDNVSAILVRYIASAAGVAATSQNGENINVSDISNVWEQHEVTMTVVRAYVILYEKHGHVEYTKEMVEEMLSEVIEKVKDMPINAEPSFTIQ